MYRFLGYIRSNSTDTCIYRNFPIVQNITKYKLVLDECSLDSEELAWVNQLYPTQRFIQNKLAFAIMFKVAQYDGVYPERTSTIPSALIQTLAHQLAIDPHCLDNFDWSAHRRTVRRFRQLIRAKLGLRPPTTADRLPFIAWFKQNVAAADPTLPRARLQSQRYFQERHMEQPKPASLLRYIQTALSEFEHHYFSEIVKSLTSTDKKTLDDFLKSKQSIENPLTITQPILLQDLKTDLRVMKIDAISEHLLTLNALLALPLPLLTAYPRKLLLKYFQRVMAQPPGELRDAPETTRYATLAIFCFIQRQQMLDTLSDRIGSQFLRLRSKAKFKITQEVVHAVCVDGKFDILHALADTAINSPEGIIQETIYPKVSKEKLTAVVEDLDRRKGRWYKEQVKRKMQSLYSHHHRRLLLPLLQVLTFKPHHDEDKPVIEAIQFILTQADNGKTHCRLSEDIPIAGVVSQDWHSLVIEKGKRVDKVNLRHYELALFNTLSKRLACKAIWVEGAYRYQDPNRDLPQDFEQQRSAYLNQLTLPINGSDFITALQKELDQNLQHLNNRLPNNKKVSITQRNGGWIRITAQKEPDHIDTLKTQIAQEWSTLSLLDLVKETALRTGFMEHFHTVGQYQTLKPKVLWKRLLLCLYGIGTNIGLKRISAGHEDESYNDLRYIKRRFITAACLREAISEVINATLAIRDPAIWGDYNIGVACDSTQVGVWDQNLMSSWHPRYKRSGVMIYWHVDKKSLCIYSQLKNCTSSEVASMMQGILHHGTHMNMKEATVDTYGQSVIGFAFSKLLSFDLLPKIKGIYKEKLYLPTTESRKHYPHLAPVLSEVIDWDLIRDNYGELAKYAIALKQGLVASDVILKRFSEHNYQHPVYRALVELGRAMKTIFLCRYLDSEELRIEINASQNVVERVNGFMDFMFYGKLGEISTNKTKDQELAILCLHLLQASMVYFNTLLIQEKLSEPQWKNVLTAEDKRAITPLIYNHINPYGLFPLDIDVRILIGDESHADNDGHYDKNFSESKSQALC